MQYLKQSIAVTLKIGPFIDDTDGKTPETGLTITQAEVRLSKNGANIAQKNEATSCTHDELGIYGCPINATDTATLGRLQLWVHESGALPVWHEYMVVPANVYDSLFSTDKLEVDVLQIGGMAQSATDLKDFADAGYDPSAHRTQAQMKGLDDGLITAAKIATDAITATKIAADAIGSSEFAQAAADKAWATAARALTDKAGFSLSAAGITSIWEKNISAFSGAGYAGTYLKTVYDDWLDAGRLDLILDAIAADVVNIDGASMRGTDSAALANVCTEARLAHLNADISSRSSHSAAAVWAVGTRALTDKVGFALTTAEKAAIIDAVWDELIADHLDAGSTGKELSEATAPTVEEVADQVWDELQSGHTNAGTFGKYLDAAISGVGGAVGSGALSCTWTQKDGGDNPMDNVQVWITTDEAGVNVVAGTLLTAANGEVTFMLDAGTYYVWREKGGFNFTNPQTWTVS